MSTPDPGSPSGGAAPSERASPLSLLRKGISIQGKVRYKLGDPLGSGSFGAVWRAERQERGPTDGTLMPGDVAIKFFQAPESEEQRDLIKRELSALLSLRARSIPRVYDWLVTDRLCFFVMPLFQRGSLAQVFDLAGSLDDDAAWKLLADLLRGCQAAHRAGILHLDIKPANVMLDGTGSYVLVDFGISQASQVSVGSAQTIGAGSRGYQAPEQHALEVRKFDTRTDLYGVGATVWAARTGLDLRKHPDRIDLKAPGAAPVLPALSSVAPGCSLPLERIVSSLVAADPAERPGGAAEVLARMKAAMAGEEFEGEVIRGARREHDDHEVAEIIDSLMDPLWSAVCRRADLTRYFAKFEKGEFLCREGETSHHAFILLKGKVEVARGSKILALYDQEGTFLGEISTLTGTPRTATVRAQTPVWACVFNAAEFERLLAFNPAIGIRLVKLMAERLIRSGS